MELISAMLVTVIGVIALITTLDSSRELISFSERKESAVHLAQRELEEIQALPYDGIALDDDPQACGSPCDANDPAFYVSENGVWYRWDQRPRGEECSDSGQPALNCERLLIDGVAGQVDAGREEVREEGPADSIRLHMEVQRFITAVDDDCVKQPPDVAACDGAPPGDYKRITVAVRIIGVIEGNREGLLNGGPGRPIVLSTTVRPPDAGGW